VSSDLSLARLAISNQQLSIINFQNLAWFKDHRPGHTLPAPFGFLQMMIEVARFVTIWVDVVTGHEGPEIANWELLIANC